MQHSLLAGSKIVIQLMCGEVFPLFLNWVDVTRLRRLRSDFNIVKEVEKMYIRTLTRAITHYVGIVYAKYVNKTAFRLYLRSVYLYTVNESAIEFELRLTRCFGRSADNPTNISSVLPS